MSSIETFDARPRDARATGKRFVVTLVLLWLAGVGLRVTMLAVPPVIPLLHADLKLSESGIGALSSLPSFLLGLAAVPGAMIIARLGVLRALVVGLAVTALASAFRGAASDSAFLFAMTFVMGAGIAIMQPAMPLIVRDWMPQRIGFGTAIYTNGLLVGETLAASLTIPYVLPFVGGSWRASFVFWSLPVLATAALVMALAPRRHALSDEALAQRRRWWPDWGSGLIWRLGLMVGGINALYFAPNTFLPDFLDRHGRGDLIALALTMLNLCQMPASFLMLLVADRLAAKRWPYIVSGLVSLASVVGIVAFPGIGTVICAGVLGFSNACALILALALPPILSPPHDVHRTASAMFTISYSYAMVIPVVGGYLWDATGIGATAFIPVALGAAIMAGLAATLDFAPHRHRENAD
ncbi:MAG TPA: MFS transporter [Alphaproteobacteria bacterium]|nr:MFS transporter [Alphaproteobacteria bacterium]